MSKSVRRSIRTDQAPAPGGPYSQAVAAAGLLFLAGQGPVRPDGSEVTGGFHAQAVQVFENLAAVARGAGGDLRNAVRVGVFLRNMADFEAMNEIYRGYFSEPFPARTTVQSDLPGFDIEVDAVLALDS